MSETIERLERSSALSQTQHDLSHSPEQRTTNMLTTNFEIISTSYSVVSVDVLPMCRIWESGNSKTNGMFNILTNMMQTCMQYAKRTQLCLLYTL